MLYINCVCILKACFKQVNASLVNLGQLNANSIPYLTETNHEQRNPFPLMQLQSLKKQHMAISNTVQTLNATFCLPLLTTIIKTFTQITLTLYYYATQVQKQDVSKGNLEKQNYQEHLIILSVTYYFMKIALIVWACETGKNQAMDIRTTIHDVFNSINNKEIKCELQLFSLQVMHRKNIFSAKGIIIDATLLTQVNDQSFSFIKSM
ncbi:PREDICTED: putative gustatory receptor 28b [Trachymyrmex septentrionalis]|uniref:putative gustatory receptor 28b n=1 Tax=Trachymyrmex septentrionalis TaxID=34720 RepID=UPI00084F3831|nr:PREDICTED: putative gustatory receptor 28b [Trachymyrmex septentrionalis]